MRRELDDELLARLERARQQLVRGLARAVEGQAPLLTGPQFLTLSILADDGPLTVRELASATGVAESTASRMVDGLERQAWVARTGKPDDRRAVLVVLTPTGRRTLHAHAVSKRQQWARALDGLTPSEQAQAVELLERIGTLLNGKVRA